MVLAQFGTEELHRHLIVPLKITYNSRHDAGCTIRGIFIIACKFWENRPRVKNNKIYILLVLKTTTVAVLVVLSEATSYYRRKQDHYDLFLFLSLKESSPPA